MKHQRLADIVRLSSPLNTPFGDKTVAVSILDFSGCLIVGTIGSHENGKAQIKKRFAMIAKRFFILRGLANACGFHIGDVAVVVEADVAEQPAIAHIQHFLQGGDVAVFQNALAARPFF